MSNSSGRTRRPTAWRAPSAARRTTRPAPRRTSRPALASGFGPVPGTVPGTCPKASLRVPPSLHLRTIRPADVSRVATAEGLSLGLGPSGLRPVVEHGFDVVPVGIEHEGAVIALVVLRPLARSAIVAEAGLQRGPVERVDRRLVGSRKGDVDVLGHRLALDECERAAGARDVEAALVAVADVQADGRRDRLVEEARLREVANADPEVVEPVYAPLDPLTVHRLEAVAVRVSDEG